MRVLVVTVVHVPTDARILHRQIRALVDAGHDVAYAAPWSATGATPPSHVRSSDLPRATGRSRRASIQAARRLLRDQGPGADVILLHDPELLLAVRGLEDLPPTVWDVHEDTAAALVDKSWVPAWSRRAVGGVVARLERWAERNLHLILAEERYRDRFAGDHPVIANHPRVPDEVPRSGDDRVVYVGRISRLRGAHELIEVGRALRGDVRVELIGAADADVEPDLRAAVAEGAVTWDGFVPNDVALPRLGGALAGLSLLHDEPNYRVSMPTKVYEYLAWGVPAITTPLPLAEAFVRDHDAGIVVPFGDPSAVVAAVNRLRADDEARGAMATRGRDAVAAAHDWNVTAVRFVELLEGWAS